MAIFLPKTMEFFMTLTLDFTEEESSNVRILSIRGTNESVHNAETLIYSQINNQPILDVKEIFIPTVSKRDSL